MFQIGDKIFYPRHGAGVIHSIETKEVLGKVQEYYTISIPNVKMEIMIPKDRAKSIGLRKIADNEVLETILANIRNGNLDSEQTSWKDRLKLNSDRLKTGYISDTADIFIDLYNRNKEKPLNAMEKQILTEAQKYLISEICLIKGISESEATELLISS